MVLPLSRRSVPPFQIVVFLPSPPYTPPSIPASLLPTKRPDRTGRRDLPGPLSRKEANQSKRRDWSPSFVGPVVVLGPEFSFLACLLESVLPQLEQVGPAAMPGPSPSPLAPPGFGLGGRHSADPETARRRPPVRPPDTATAPGPAPGPRE